MKIVLLSGASSIHTVRWANGLSSAGHTVHVITQHPTIDPFLEAVHVHQFPYSGVLGYFLMVPKVKRLLRNLRPDIVNAHYASGYGTTARLTNYHPWILSVWGSDVYDFPYKSILHKFLIKKNILSADNVASTSLAMARQTQSLIPELKELAITPFGVELKNYEKIRVIHENNENDIIIGTVKTMARKYGIDILIKAFSEVHTRLQRNNPELAKKIKLRLVGGGPQLSELKDLANRLNISKLVTFVGQVPHTQVPNELEKMDIYVALSRLDSESFGVAIIEAGAAGRPVIVSNVGGLPEVTVQDKTGLVVPKENSTAAADALEKLILNPALRKKMGIAAKEHVKEQYSWSSCIETMLGLYENVITKHR